MQTRLGGGLRNGVHGSQKIPQHKTGALLAPGKEMEVNLEGSVRSRGETATTLTVRDLIEAGLNKPAGSQALWG
jgi:hypothetical protein